MGVIIRVQYISDFHFFFESSVSHGLDSISPRSSQDISRDLDQRICASLQRDSARDTLKRVHLFASRDAPSAPLPDNWGSVLDDICHLVYFDWLKSVQWLRSCQHDVILSRKVVRHPASLSHLSTFSWSLLVDSSRTSYTQDTICRFLQKKPNELLSTFRYYGHIVCFDSFIFSDIFFDVVYAWRHEYV